MADLKSNKKEQPKANASKPGVESKRNPSLLHDKCTLLYLLLNSIDKFLNNSYNHI